MPHLLATLCAFVSAGALAAQSLSYQLALNGGEEVPIVVTTGTGTATVTLNTATNMVTVNGTYTNMAGTVTAAHIHATARRGANAGVALGLTTSGGTSGTFSGSGTVTAAQAQAIVDGLAYLNVHTAVNPGGEIRAQIDTVPGAGSPGAGLLQISGTAAPGGMLDILCPRSTLNQLIVISAALPPGQVLQLPPSLACTPPANIGINVSIPPLVVGGPGVMLPIPAGLPPLHLAVQCVGYPPSASCLDLSGAARVAIRP